MADRPIQSVGYRGLLEALGEAGCPACRISRRSAERHIRALLWESVTDVDTRQRLRASHGFCRPHTIAAIRVAGDTGLASGMAILMGDLLRVVTGEAQAAADRRRGARRVAATAPCPICETATLAAGTAVDLLADAVEGGELHAAARRPDRSLCLPHLQLGLRRTTTRERAGRLAELFTDPADRLRTDLAGYVRKHDYRSRHETITPAERRGLVEAARLLFGEL